MNTKTIVSKLKKLAKVSLLFLTIFAMDVALAEYYIVYPAPVPNLTCINHQVKDYGWTSGDKKNGYTITETRSWQGVCPCSYVWVPTHCDHCGREAPGYWRLENCNFFYAIPARSVIYLDQSNNDHDLDRATVDDDPSNYPGMDIDN